MTHELRFLERVRQRFASLLHLPLSLVGLYAERETPREQYACTVQEPYKHLEAHLHREGFVRNLVSSMKYRSYATPSEATAASWARYPDGALRSTHQLHLGLFVGPDRETTDVYAHWEPSWIRHPIRHYRAREVDAEAGVERARESLEAAGLECARLPENERFDVHSPENTPTDADPETETDPDGRD